MSLKHKIHQHCREAVALKLAAQQEKLRDLAASAANETKSSAGDKYETARAMLHMEQDGVRQQIAGLMAQQVVLNGIDPDKESLRVGQGSLVVTNRGSYFLSIALGKMQVHDQTVIALSIQSPLGAKLKGLQAGDRLELNGQNLLIEAIH